MRGILQRIYAVQHIEEHVSRFLVRVLPTRYVRKKCISRKCILDGFNVATFGTTISPTVRQNIAPLNIRRVAKLQQFEKWKTMHLSFMVSNSRYVESCLT